MRLRARIGFTIIELLVYSVLLLLLLGAVYSIFTQSLRYGQFQQASVDLQNSAQAILSKMTKEIANSHVPDDTKAVSTSGNVTGFIFMSADTGKPSTSSSPKPYLDSSGTLYWQKWVCYYWDNSASGSTAKCLVRREWKGDSNLPTTDTSTYDAGSNIPTVSNFVSGGTNYTTVQILNTIDPRTLVGNVYQFGFSWDGQTLHISAVFEESAAAAVSHSTSTSTALQNQLYMTDEVNVNN